MVSADMAEIEVMRLLAGRTCAHNRACDKCQVRHISMCSTLQGDDLDIVGDIRTTVNVDAKKTLFSEGDPAECLFNIRSGTVRLSKMLADGRRQITGFLFPGDFFGLACKDVYNYTAEAIEPVDLCRFPRKKLFGLFTDLPELGEKVFEITRTELQSTHEQMLLLGRKTAQEKICSFLIMLQKKSGRTDDVVDLPMNRSDIADYLGLTIETVSRQFGKLADQSLIRVDGPHHIILLDEEKIADLCETER